MNLFANMNLDRKLLISFASILVLTGVGIGGSLWGLRQLNERLNFIVETRVEALKRSTRLHRNISELRTQEKEIILATDADWVARANDRIEAVRVEIEHRIDELEELDLSRETAMMVEDFRLAYRRFNRTLDQILDLNQEQRVEEARLLSRTEGLERSDSAVALAQRLTEIQEAALATAKEESDQLFSRMVNLTLVLLLVAMGLGTALALIVGRNVAGSVGRIVAATGRIADGDLETSVEAEGRDEIGQLAAAVGRMQGALREARGRSEDQAWLQTGLARLNEVVLGQEDVEKLAGEVIAEIASYLNAKVGVLYMLEEQGGQPFLRLLGSFAYAQRKNLSNRFALGEGLVGQAALERKQIMIQNAPEDYVRVVSGLGESVPRNICVTPFLFEGNLRGVIEMGTLHPMSDLELQYLEQVTAAVATAFEMARSQQLLRTQQEELRSSNEELQEQTAALEQSQEELKNQQEELKTANTELEMQMRRVQESEERLKVQQEEMEITNRELESKNELLERQKDEMEQARRDIAAQAEEVALASRYKSEFLANMSHELRTPLNSLLLLARSLRDNQEGNLNQDQIESAGIIFDSGSDLLNLINEILDLSRIEAGRMELHLERVEVAGLGETVRAQFEHMAHDQGLSLEVVCEEGAPSHLITDSQRLGQVIKNLMGNALKFTEEGGVTVSFAPVEAGTDLGRSGLEPAESLAIRVADTGIGIPEDKQKIIFEAFQQADTGDRRRYGGTGLGLSISRELVALLGGEMQLVSEPGKGSTFTLYVPLERGATEAATGGTGAVRAPLREAFSAPLENTAPQREGGATPVKQEPAMVAPSSRGVADDRENIEDGDRAILVVEDDIRFAGILVGYVRERGFRCLVAHSGEEGLELAKTHCPDGVLLDINLPQMDGWAVLSELKRDVDTRHIPVHIVSVEEQSAESLRIGAIGHASKPLQKEEIEEILKRLEGASAQAEKQVLVIEDEPAMRRETVRLIGNGNVHVDEVETGQQGLEALRACRFDLVVMDLGLPDMQGLTMLETLAREEIPLPPIIVHTVRELTVDEEMALRRYADSIILKDVRSQERLIDEVALFLHRVVGDLPEEKRQAIQHLHESDEPLKGKTVLVVEDDMRTMFAMSRLLAGHGVNPLKAENGEKALAMLDEHSDVDLVLMDMMMPVLDGYGALERIRAQDRFSQLPIIALTAKAMKEDRQKCLEAGASDYLSKPVEEDRLLSLMRVWLYR